jgi:hypothetical protein
MKAIFYMVAAVTILSISARRATAQKISFNKLLSFLSASEGKTEKDLQYLKYNYGHRQNIDSAAHMVYEYWDYKDSSLEYHIILKINPLAHLIESVTYAFYNKEEYSDLLNSLPGHGFSKNDSLSFNKGSTHEEFKKGDTHVIMSTTKSFGDHILYKMEICFCSLR